jgi:hypothetical protein
LGILHKHTLKDQVNLSHTARQVAGTIWIAYLSDEMQTDAIDIATQGFDCFNIEKDIMAFLSSMRQNNLFPFDSRSVSNQLFCPRDRRFGRDRGGSYI